MTARKHPRKPEPDGTMKWELVEDLMITPGTQPQEFNIICRDKKIGTLVMMKTKGPTRFSFSLDEGTTREQAQPLITFSMLLGRQAMLATESI